MQLSVIIVNYNVKHFLEQCLCSVENAIQGMDAEIIVVDNHSSDNSLAYLDRRFLHTRFIANTENKGFAKACNQGLAIASGRNILFLNPDTIVPEDCLRACLDFFSQTPDAGAIGVKMLDGSGRFLKESKRSFPSPLTSFYKLVGLSRLFPSSKTFSRYHLGHLPEESNHEVDVLAGAFMMIRKEVLDTVGGFDETFFMYGEDVDLSYRIQKGGYKNYYFSGSDIIHFKGESTRRGSMNYVRMFYNAMSIFVRKHYGGSRAGIFNVFIHIAIWLRALVSALGRFIRSVGLPLIDAGFIVLSFWLMKNIWNQYVRMDIVYENRLLWIAIPAYAVFYLIAAYYAGLYDRWYRWSELVRSSVVATVVLLAAYAMLPEQYRFSRGIILFGAMLAFLLISIQRWILVKAGMLSSNREKEQHANTLVVASPGEYLQLLVLMKEAGFHERVLGRVAVNDEDKNGVGHWTGIRQLLRVLPSREIIFYQGQLSYRQIISSMQELPLNVKVKIHSEGSFSIVGSDSKDSSGEALSHEKDIRLSNPYNRRIKRLIDVVTSIAALLTFPVHLFAVRKPFSFFGNCLAILSGKKTWIGYTKEKAGLPPLRKAVIACNGIPMSEQQQLPAESLQMMDYWYARDYDPQNDLKLLRRSYRRLGG